MFVVLGLGVLAWTLLRPPDEVGPSEKANVFVAPSAASIPPGTDALRALPTPAQVAVVPSASPEASPESLASQPTSQATVVLSNERPLERVAVEPSWLATSPEQDLYPSPIQTHLEVAGKSVSALADAMELDEEAARALTSIIAEHVRAERALWDEAKVYGDAKLDEQELERIDRRTLESIRQSPGLGDGMARVVERILVPLVRDPGRAIDPDQTVLFGVTELRSLARGE